MILNPAPKISVIIPLFNKEVYIKNTLASVRSQIFRDFEVIIVDDGSTDKGVSIARQAIEQDERFCFVHQANAGVSAARNHGASLARGTLLAFLDADDQWDREFLEHMWAIRICYPSAKLYSCAYRIKRQSVIEERSFGLSSRLAVNYPFFSLAVTHGPAIWTSATLVDASAFAKLGGFPLGMSLGEDILLWVKFIAEGDFVFLNVHLATYDMSDASSISKRVGAKALADRRRLIRFLEDFGASNLSIPKAYLNAFREIQLAELIRGGLFLEAFGYYLTNILRFPFRGAAHLLRGLKTNIFRNV